MDHWLATEYELELFKRDLESFVPDRVFDAHVHLYDTGHFPEEDIMPLHSRGPTFVGADVFLRYIDGIHPGRSATGLCFPYPRPGTDLEAAHGLVADEVAKLPAGRGQMLIKPSLDPEYIRETVRAKGFVGLKPYSVFSTYEPRPESPVEAFLPEQHVKVADEEGLTITLHMSKKRGIADEENQASVRRYSQKYPDMKLILAHAGRGYNPYQAAGGASAYADLGNVYFDTAVAMESGTFERIIDAVGHTRLLWASDFPVSQDRGRAVAIGDQYVWLTPEMLTDTKPFGENVMPVMQGYESLRALKLAAMSLRLTDSQVEDIFYNNLAALYEY